MMNHYELIFSLFLMEMYPTMNGLNSWCSPYDTFCLFSEGIETSVSDLSEAQFKCSEIKNDSWPVELGDERVKEVFIEFIRNYSISNVILNAYNPNGTWYWKKKFSLVQNYSSYFFETTDERNLYCNYSKERFINGYAVVCMNSCHAEWTDIGESVYEDQENGEHYPKTNELQECKKLCETNATCSAINWVYSRSWEGCWFLKYPYNASKVKNQSQKSHHVVDRTSKSVSRCIGEGKEPNDPKNKVFLASIISVLGVITCVIVLATLCLRKPAGGFYSDPDEDKVSQAIDNFDKVKEFIPREPNRYFGPRGDQYTEVILDDKISVAGNLKKNKA